MTPCTGNLKFGEMEFGEMKRNTSNWSNFCMLPRRAGLSALAGLSCSLIMLLRCCFTFVTVAEYFVFKVVFLHCYYIKLAICFNICIALV